MNTIWLLTANIVNCGGKQEFWFYALYFDLSAAIPDICMGIRGVLARLWSHLLVEAREQQLGLPG